MVKVWFPMTPFGRRASEDGLDAGYGAFACEDRQFCPGRKFREMMAFGEFSPGQVSAMSPMRRITRPIQSARLLLGETRPSLYYREIGYEYVHH
jgi:hypothetical protein